MALAECPTVRTTDQEFISSCPNAHTRTQCVYSFDGLAAARFRLGTCGEACEQMLLTCSAAWRVPEDDFCAEAYEVPCDEDYSDFDRPAREIELFTLLCGCHRPEL